MSYMAQKSNLASLSTCTAAIMSKLCKFSYIVTNNDVYIEI